MQLSSMPCLSRVRITRLRGLSRVALVAALGAACTSSTPASQSRQPVCSGLVQVDDAPLQAAIRSIAELGPGDPLDAETLADVKTLDASGAGIASLTGLECLVGLRTLELANNSIDDVAPLGELNSLTSLLLDGNAIADVAPISELRGLVTLQLSNNAIADVAPLGSLPRVAVLELDDNALVDVDGLAALTGVVSLSLRNNAITDVSPLGEIASLTLLDITGNPIDCDAQAEALDALDVLISAKSGSFEHDCP